MISKPTTTKDGKNVTDACSQITGGIASAIQSGALNLGGNVSSMGYGCTKPVKSEDELVKAKEEQKVKKEEEAVLKVHFDLSRPLPGEETKEE